MFEVVADELTLALVDTIERIQIKIVDQATGDPVDATGLSMRVTDLGGNVIYADNLLAPPTPPGVTRIQHPALGTYYFPLGDPSVIANTETSLSGELLIVWNITVGTEADNIVQTVKVVTPYVLHLVSALRNQIDKAVLRVVEDPDNPCFLGYTDKALVEYLEGGLSSINAYQPYPTFACLEQFPHMFKQTLIESALIVGIQSQELFAIAKDIPNFCFAAGAPVIMADGTPRPIEDVEPGMIVTNRLGYAAKVTDAWSETAAEDLVRIVTWGGRTFDVTANHNFPVWAWPRTCGCGCGQDVKPGRLYTHGHHVRVANPQHDTKLPETVSLYGTRNIPADYEPVQKLQAQDIRVGDFLLMPRQFKTVDTDVSPDEARLLGYYAAEGCLTDRESGRPGNMCLTFNEAERYTWAEDVETIARRAGVTTRTSDHPTSYAFQLRTRNDYGRCPAARRWVDLALEHVGELSHLKRLSAEVMGWSIELKTEFLRCLLRGDGSQHWMVQSSKGETCRSFLVTYSSSSAVMFAQVQLLLAQLGYPTRCSTAPAKNVYAADGKVFRGREHHRLTVPMPFARKLAHVIWDRDSRGDDFSYGRSGRRMPRSECMVDENFIYVPVKQISRVPAETKVYNLTVAGDHSYLVAGLGTYNSAQGSAFVIQHQPQLAQFATRLSQRLDKLIPIMKLHFVRSGVIHTQVSPNSRLQAVVDMAPGGALFRNVFLSGG